MCAHHRAAALLPEASSAACGSTESDVTFGEARDGLAEGDASSATAAGGASVATRPVPLPAPRDPAGAEQGDGGEEDRLLADLGHVCPS